MGTKRVALVTGGASGIGAAVVRRLRRRGDTVVSADVTECGEDPGAVRLDVTDVEGWATAVSSLIERHGQWDVLVNAAGLQGDLSNATVADCTIENWNTVMNVNVTGTFLGCRAALRRMAPTGAIVNLSSIASYYPTAYNAVYGASKGAVTQLTKTVAFDGAPHIRCNSVHPGIISTPMLESILTESSEESDTSFVDRIPLQRPGSADEVAALIDFLTSQDSGFVTGAEYVIDGGSRLVR